MSRRLDDIHKEQNGVRTLMAITGGKITSLNEFKVFGQPVTLAQIENDSTTLSAHYSKTLREAIRSLHITDLQRVLRGNPSLQRLPYTIFATIPSISPVLAGIATVEKDDRLAQLTPFYYRGRDPLPVQTANLVRCYPLGTEIHRGKLAVAFLSNFPTWVQLQDVKGDNVDYVGFTDPHSKGSTPKTSVAVGQNVSSYLSRQALTRICSRTFASAIPSDKELRAIYRSESPWNVTGPERECLKEIGKYVLLRFGDMFGDMSSAVKTGTLSDVFKKIAPHGSDVSPHEHHYIARMMAGESGRYYTLGARHEPLRAYALSHLVPTALDLRAYALGILKSGKAEVPNAHEEAKALAKTFEGNKYSSLGPTHSYFIFKAPFASLYSVKSEDNSERHKLMKLIAPLDYPAVIDFPTDDFLKEGEMVRLPITILTTETKNVPRLGSYTFLIGTAGGVKWLG